MYFAVLSNKRIWSFLYNFILANFCFNSS